MKKPHVLIKVAVIVRHTELVAECIAPRSRPSTPRSIQHRLEIDAASTGREEGRWTKCPLNTGPCVRLPRSARSTREVWAICVEGWSREKAECFREDCCRHQFSTLGRRLRYLSLVREPGDLAADFRDLEATNEARCGRTIVDGE